MIIIYILLSAYISAAEELTFNLYTDKKDAQNVSVPSYSIETNKWWSNSIFGNVHKKICKKSFEFISSKDFPDLIYYKSKILDGCADEEGHYNPKSNGGDVYRIWNGKITNNNRIIGVLYNYKHLNWNEAYENIGAMIHLTQDQATPVHAANINHSYFDQFERFYESDLDINLINIDIDIPENIKPWEYYIFVQKDTRKHLKKWKDPENGIPYWEESPQSLPLDQDNTLGPYGNYGGGKDHFAKMHCEEEYDAHNNCTTVPKSPEIRQRQITVSVITTKKLLKSASKNLPPLITDIKTEGNQISISIEENRCREVKYYIDNTLKGTIKLSEQFPFRKIFKLKKGFKNIKIEDCDGNISEAEL